jgi:hypothetical protein
LVAVMLGAGIAGIFGMMFFIPLFSIIYTLIHRNAKLHLKRKGIPSPVRTLSLQDRKRHSKTRKKEKLSKKEEMKEDVIDDITEDLYDD